MQWFSTWAPQKREFSPINYWVPWNCYNVWMFRFRRTILSCQEVPQRLKNTVLMDWWIGEKSWLKISIGFRAEVLKLWHARSISWQLKIFFSSLHQMIPRWCILWSAENALTTIMISSKTNQSCFLPPAWVNWYSSLSFRVHQLRKDSIHNSFKNWLRLTSH